MKSQSTKKATGDFLMLLSKPARRALQQANINSLQALKNIPDEELLKLHGFGKSSIQKLRSGLLENSDRHGATSPQKAAPLKNVEDYIDQFPASTKTILKKIRKIIKGLAPDAEEQMNYGMPGYKLNKKPLVYFAGYDNHIGFYATPSGHLQFQQALSKYKQGKGSVQFPLSQSIPYDLIRQMVQFRAEENRKAQKK